MRAFSGTTSPADRNERRRLEYRQAAPLGQIYPALAELYLELEFRDGSSRPPSAQTYRLYPAARGMFRYPCPCNNCDGELDLTGYVAEIASQPDGSSAIRRFKVVCPGQRLEQGSRDGSRRAPCPIQVHICISATARSKESV